MVPSREARRPPSGILIFSFIEVLLDLISNVGKLHVLWDSKECPLCACFTCFCWLQLGKGRVRAGHVCLDHWIKHNAIPLGCEQQRKLSKINSNTGLQKQSYRGQKKWVQRWYLWESSEWGQGKVTHGKDNQNLWQSFIAGGMEGTKEMFKLHRSKGR